MGNQTPYKTVGIVTLQGKTNYGNRLQNYAVAKLYEQLGCKVTTLLRESRSNLKRRVLELARNVVHPGMALKNSQGDAERIAAFERFDSALRFQVINEFDNNISDSFDYFSVGSDQVWNLGRMSDNDRWYYLKFARTEQRIALAPSIGVSQLDNSQMKRLANGVSGFPHLSVREQRGAELIKECSGLEAKVICDPTMVLQSEDWRHVADSRLTPAGPYVFAYLLGDRNPAATEVLEAVTRGGIPIVNLSDKARPGEPSAGPAEFISLIDSASHVVTDSFHAAVFSAILQTPLTIVRREGGAGMFSRIETLGKMLNIEHKIYGLPNFDIARAGDYEGISKAIERERGEFMKYMEACLND